MNKILMDNEARLIKIQRQISGFNLKTKKAKQSENGDLPSWKPQHETETISLLPFYNTL